MKNIDLEELINKYEQGMKVHELAEFFECTPNTIHRRISKYYIAMEQEKTNPELNNIIKDFESGVTRNELAEIYGYSYAAIAKKIRDYYVDIKKESRKDHKDTKVIKELVNLCEKGFTDTQIAKMYNCSKQNINEKLVNYYKELGLKKPKNNRIKVDVSNIITCMSNGDSMTKISKESDYTFCTIKHRVEEYCKENNIEKKDLNIKRIEEVKNIVNLYELGYTQVEIASKCNLTQDAISKTLVRYYKNINQEKPKFLERKEIRAFFKRSIDFKKLENLANEKNKKVSTKKVIEALKQYRKEIYLYYLDEFNMYRYNLNNEPAVINKPKIKIKNREWLKYGKNNK